MSQTLEQKRAEYSYECVDNIKNLDFASKFQSLVKRTPTLILTNGFGNTMAFLFSKGNPEHLTLSYIIGRYLFEENEYTKGILGKNDIFKGNREDFFNFYKDLNRLNETKNEYGKLKNKLKEIENNNQDTSGIEQEIENKKNEFNSLFEKLENNYERYLNDNLKNKDIDKFKKKEYLQLLSLKMQNSIFSKLVFTDTDRYILATEETLRLLNWLRRFVEAMIEDEKDKKEEG